LSPSSFVASPASLSSLSWLSCSRFGEQRSRFEPLNTIAYRKSRAVLAIRTT